MSGLSNEKTNVLQHNPDKHNKLNAKPDGVTYEDKLVNEVDLVLKDCEDVQAKKKKRHRRNQIPGHAKKTPDKLDACEPTTTAQATESELSKEVIDDWLNMFKPVEAQRESQQNQSAELSRSMRKKKKKCSQHARDKTMSNEHTTSVDANYILPLRPVREPQRKRGSGHGMTLKITRHSKHGEGRRVISFLDLPRELRDMIYNLCIPDLSGITTNVRNQLEGYYDGMGKINQMRQHNKVRHLIQRLAMRHGQLETPNVLLLNRQIYEEAILYLRKQTIMFNSPAIICDEFPISRLLSPDLLRTVKEVHFEMPMKQHTHATMLGEMQMGYNWWSKSSTACESLNHAQPWGFFVNSIASILQDPGHQVQQMTFSITNGIFGRKEYVLQPHSGNMGELNKTVHTCLRSRNLDRFLRFLQLASISYIEHPNDSYATSNDKDGAGDASNAQTNP